MNPFRYTLVADGSSDRCLRRFINYVLDEIPGIAELGSVPQFAGPSETRTDDYGLSPRLHRAVKLFPCDLLFVHRDAERDPPENRREEIRRACAGGDFPTVVPVIPVRMTEAWLLIDENAIRRAADNPNGSARLTMPGVAELEFLPNPKKILFDLLEVASEKKGRRLAQFKTTQSLSSRRARVADLIRDMSPLTSLPAFEFFQRETQDAVGHWLDQQSQD